MQPLFTLLSTALDVTNNFFHGFFSFLGGAIRVAKVELLLIDWIHDKDDFFKRSRLLNTVADLREAAFLL